MGLLGYRLASKGLRASAPKGNIKHSYERGISDNPSLREKE